MIAPVAGGNQNCTCSCGYCTYQIPGGHERCPYACGRAVCWLGQTESDLHEAAAIERHDRMRYEARIADAEAQGWLTPDEVREALGRPRKGTAPGSAAPPTPAPLPGESECAAPGAAGEPGGGPDSPRPVSLRPIGRILRLRWTGRG